MRSKTSEPIRKLPLYKEIGFFNPIVHIVNLTVLMCWSYDWYTSQLGANSPEKLIHFSGWWALFLLVLTLLVTPLVQIKKWHWLGLIRRPLGVWSAVFASLHLLFYAAYDKSFRAQDILIDISKRPFILVGFLAWLLLMPLLATSTPESIRKMGSKKWKTLHKLTYLIAPLAALHFFMKEKSDVREPVLFTFVVLLLLGYRFIRNRVKPDRLKK